MLSFKYVNSGIVVIAANTIITSLLGEIAVFASVRVP